MKVRSSDLALALRTTLAGLISFGVAHLLQLPQAYWAVLTSVIIMQSSVGGSLKAGLDRLLGTFAGAVWGAGVTLALPHHDLLSLGLSLAVALAPLTLVAALYPGYRIAPVTAIIVLLSTTGAQIGPVRYAVERVEEIGLGCVIGFAVSILILPARAHQLLAETVAQVMLAARDLLDLLLHDVVRAPDSAALAATRERLNAALRRVEGLIDEVRRERSTRLTDAPDPEPAARILRRLSHDLSAIGRAVMEPLPEPARHHLGEAIAGLRRAISDDLAASAASFGDRGAPPSLEAVDEALREFRDSMEQLRQSGLLREMSTAAVEQVFSLAFALQQLRRDLGDLSALARI